MVSGIDTKRSQEINSARSAVPDSSGLWERADNGNPAMHRHNTKASHFARIALSFPVCIDWLHRIIRRNRRQEMPGLIKSSFFVFMLDNSRSL